LSKYYLEGCLAQAIFYSCIWLFDEYVGLLLCLIITIVVGGLLIFALIAEAIQGSKVPRSYFIWMLISSITPALVAIIFSVLYNGQFDWM